MRPDLNKLLCEHERYGSGMSFKDVRHDRQDEIYDRNGEFTGPTRESMRERYVRAYRTKSFGENLNPLYGWVRKNANRPWDKVYSELCQTFNMDSVINQHILSHLFDFVETKTKEECGKVLIHGWGGRWNELKDSYAEFFVHPRTGILTKNKYKGFLRAQRDKEWKARCAAEAAKTVWLTDLHCAVFVDGQWYENVYDYQVVTIYEVEVETPEGETLMVNKKVYKYPSWGGTNGTKVCVKYRQLNKREMKRYGLIKK